MLSGTAKIQKSRKITHFKNCTYTVILYQDAVKFLHISTGQRRIIAVFSVIDVHRNLKSRLGDRLFRLARLGVCSLLEGPSPL